MVTDRHIQRLHRFDQQGWPKGQAAAKAGIDDKTARKYRRLGRLPSEVRMDHTWRTRPDPFAGVWPEVEEQLTLNPGLEALTLLAWLQRQYPGRFAEGQLRTLQRRVKQWRALQGRPRKCSSPRCITPAGWAPPTSRTAPAWASPSTVSYFRT